MLRAAAKAGERLRIAREPHDLIGHQLTALTLEWEVAAHTTHGDAAAHVDRVRGTAKNLLASVRHAVSSLRTSRVAVTSAFGVVSAIEKPEAHRGGQHLDLRHRARQRFPPDRAAVVMIRVCVADDQTLVRQGIRGALATLPAGPPALVLTTFDDDELVVGALRAGAKGYLLKDVTLDEPRHAIRTPHAGGHLIQRR